MAKPAALEPLCDGPASESHPSVGWKLAAVSTAAVNHYRSTQQKLIVTHALGQIDDKVLHVIARDCGPQLEGLHLKTKQTPSAMKTTARSVLNGLVTRIPTCLVGSESVRTVSPMVWDQQPTTPPGDESDHETSRKLGALLGMGFGEDAARAALIAEDGSVERAMAAEEAVDALLAAEDDVDRVEENQAEGATLDAVGLALEAAAAPITVVDERTTPITGASSSLLAAFAEAIADEDEEDSVSIVYSPESTRDTWKKTAEVAEAPPPAEMPRRKPGDVLRALALKRENSRRADRPTVLEAAKAAHEAAVEKAWATKEPITPVTENEDSFAEEEQQARLAEERAIKAAALAEAAQVAADAAGAKRVAAEMEAEEAEAAATRAARREARARRTRAEVAAPITVVDARTTPIAGASGSISDATEKVIADEASASILTAAPESTRDARKKAVYTVKTLLNLKPKGAPGPIEGLTTCNPSRYSSSAAWCLAALAHGGWVKHKIAEDGPLLERS